MKFCQHCGKELNDEAVICVHCGCSVQTTPAPKVQAVDQSVSAGLVVLSILIPLVGFIYWPLKAKTRPRCAKICGISAIVAWALSFVLTLAARGI